MLTVKTVYATDPDTARLLDTTGLREKFHVGGMFVDGEIHLTYTHYDRLILGGAVPAGASLVLDHVPECGSASILDRREMGILNVGETGTIAAAGEVFEMNNGDVLYLPVGAGAVTFSGNGRFYITSAPAHRSLTAKLIRPKDANQIELGSPKTANHRTIYQHIHPDVVESCQLVMGYTKLHTGSVWNTMPAHTHHRRMEAYLYFDVVQTQAVCHIMGQPDETRHIMMHNEEAVISPPWSIHCGAGTTNYSFCWVMAGDNIDFTDMDMVPIEDLR